MEFPSHTRHASNARLGHVRDLDADQGAVEAEHSCIHDVKDCLQRHCYNANASEGTHPSLVHDSQHCMLCNRHFVSGT